MAQNMANADRLIRSLIVAPLALIAAYLLGWTSAAGIVLIVVAALMLGTGIVGWCPIYALLGRCPLRAR